MTAEQKIAQKKLTLLQIAAKIKNVAEACRQAGVCRSQFYEYKRAFQEFGFEGLLDRPPVPKSCPHKTPSEVQQKVIALSLEHPAWGRFRLTDHLRLQGIALSASTVRNIWVKEDLESRYKRLLRLDEQRNGTDLVLTEEQIRLLEKANPCFRERRVESPYPGYLLCQDTFFVGRLKGIGRIWLQAVVDTFGSFAFGKLYISKAAETAVDLLYDRVLPFYASEGIPVENILTDNGREYFGRPMVHPYEIFLGLNEIAHRRTRVGRPRTNGFVERFNRTALDEFFRETFRNTFYTSVQGLQEAFDRWLHFYNYERPHRGYRNMGRRPIETIETGKLIREQCQKAAN